MEKTLILVLVFVTLAAIGFLVGLIVLAVQDNDDSNEFCLTPVCVKEAARIIGDMNEDADP